MLYQGILRSSNEDQHLVRKMFSEVIKQVRSMFIVSYTIGLDFFVQPVESPPAVY